MYEFDLSLFKYMNIHFCSYVNTARDVVTHCNTQAHVYDQQTRGMATTRHMCLVQRGGRKFLRPQAVVRDKGLAHKKRNVRKPNISNPKKKDFEHIKLPAKLLDYFLRSNKSNIDQSDFCAATCLIL